MKILKILDESLRHGRFKYDYPMADNAEGLKLKDTKNIGKNETGSEYLLSMQVMVDFWSTSPRELVTGHFLKIGDWLGATAPGAGGAPLFLSAGP